MRKKMSGGKPMQGMHYERNVDFEKRSGGGSRGSGGLQGHSEHNLEPSSSGGGPKGEGKMKPKGRRY